MEAQNKDSQIYTFNNVFGKMSGMLFKPRSANR